MELEATPERYLCINVFEEANMGLGKGALLWLIGIPLPIIVIVAVLMHH